MNDISLFGKTKSESQAFENQICRELVVSINDLSLTQRQQMFLIYQLALQLEDVNVMQEITQHIKELCPEIFISTQE